MADVAQFGLDALATMRKNVVLNEDITEGLLFGLNGDGEAVKADASTGVVAKGIVIRGSASGWGEAVVFNKVSTLKVGDYTDLNKYAVIDVPAGTYTNSQIGGKLYLGTAGAYTTTKNTTLGQLNQEVGYVLSTDAVAIDLTKDTKGTVNVAGNFDVFEVSTAGALSTAGISLVTTGAGDLALTLGTPKAGTQVRIKLVVDGGGNAVVTTEAGVTFDGTNNQATFADALDELVLGYKSATEWIIIENVGAVALAAV